MAGQQKTDHPTGQPPEVPWIECAVVNHDSLPSSWPAEYAGQDDAAHAFFAAAVRPLDFGKRKAHQWGFNSEALRTEASGRQHQFLAGLREPDDLIGFGNSSTTTLALQCYAQEDGLQLSLLGKQCGSDEETARKKALDLWPALKASFPYDYELTPLKTRQEMLAVTGNSLLEELQDPASLSELHRYEVYFSTDQRPAFLLGSWNSMIRGDEPIWRAMAAMGQRALWRVTVRPVMLHQAEWAALEEMTGAVVQLAENTGNPLVSRESDWARSAWQERQTTWRQPYLVQTHLAVEGHVPETLLRVIGMATTYTTGDDRPRPHYQVRRPADHTALTSWLDDLKILGFVDAANRHPDSRLLRFPYLAGIEEALAVFRWPFPPQGGLPGVHFKQPNPKKNRPHPIFPYLVEER